MSAIMKSEKTRWLRNTALAEYLGTTNMTIYRWRRNPAVNFPAATVISGIEYTDLQEVERWMKARVVNRMTAKEKGVKTRGGQQPLKETAS